MGTSNLMAGVYSAEGTVSRTGGPTLSVGKRTGIPDGASVNVSVRPEKIWLSEHEQGMVVAGGTVRETVQSGPTTTYLIDIAPGVTVAALEQNTDRSRNEERWANGRRREHCPVLT